MNNQKNLYTINVFMSFQSCSDIQALCHKAYLIILS